MPLAGNGHRGRLPPVALTILEGNGVNLDSQRIRVVACLAALVFAGCLGSRSADEKTDDALVRRV